MAFLTAMSNSFGARWFDENWKPQFDQPEWKNTLDFYLKLMADAGPPGASSNGFNENLALFNSGKCGMWIDATVAASFVTNPKDSKRRRQGGLRARARQRPRQARQLAVGLVAGHSGRLADSAEAAQKFIAWATCKHYLELVASKEGWANVPPGTRTSLYANPEYAKVPFAKMTLDSINSADPDQADREAGALCRRAVRGDPRIPGTCARRSGQIFSAALAGEKTADEALAEAQDAATREMTKAGYIK